jgi:hypothetical protein
MSESFILAPDESFAAAALSAIVPGQGPVVATLTVPFTVSV